MSLGVRGVGEFLSSLDGSEIFEDRCGVCAGVFFSPLKRALLKLQRPSFLPSFFCERANAA